MRVHAAVVGVMGLGAVASVGGAGADDAGAASIAARWAAKSSGGAASQGCGHADAIPAFEAAMERVCSESADPAATRAEVLDRLTRSVMCYTATTAEEYEAVIRRTLLLPASMLAERGEGRYASTGTVWTGNGTAASGSGGRAQRINLTFSFAPDGAVWDPGTGAASSLMLRLTPFFGAANRDRALELFRQVFAGFRRIGGITYTEVADDGAAFSFAGTRSPLRGDIRIGAIVVDGGATGVLAYNYFPGDGGDMTLNTAYMGSFSNPTNNYRYLRNVVAHEHGHGLAYFHVVPCNAQKLMEPFAQTAFDAVQMDDMRGVMRNYGDRFAGNIAAGSATDFGDLTTPAPRSVIERNLSTNGTAGFNNTDEDWFRFTLSSPQDVTITVVPTGGTYQSVANFGNGDCSGNPASINAQQAGNLNIELRNSNGTTVIQSATSAPAGSTETLFRSMTPGTYTVRIVDTGPNASANQIVQTYDLTIRVGSSKAPPQAIAGVDKRVGTGFPCWFMGDINSYANEAGAAIVSYEWDFENDGVIDASGPQVSTVYATEGTRTARLRVTDTNGMVDDDTIQVTVFAATVPPPPSSPVLLEPANGSVVNVGNPTFDWTDSTDTEFYTLVVDDDPGFGSPLFSVEALQSVMFTSPGSFQENVTYYWKVTAESSFGSTPSVPPSFSFRIVTTPPPSCLGDLDGNNTRDTVDLVAFLPQFGSVVPPFTAADLNGDGVVNTQDLVIFLARFGLPCP